MLLSHPDRSLQRLALKCKLTYRSPHLTPHQDILTALLDDTRWRDELTKLNLDEIDERDRPEFIEAFIRLLYGFMMEKRGNSKAGERRGAVISAFAGCHDEELGLFVELMLGSLRREDLMDVEGQFVNKPVPESFSESQQIGYLNLLEGVLRNLGSRLLPFWPVLLGSTLDIVAHAQKRIGAEKDDSEVPEPDEELEEEDTKAPGNASRTLKTIRQLSLKRFAQFCKSPVQFDFTPFIHAVFQVVISPRLPALAQENSQAPSALLELFYIWATKPEQAIFLTTIDHRTLPSIYDCMVAPNVKPTVITRVLDIVEALLSISSSDESVSSLVLKPYIPNLLESLATAVERSKDVAAASNVLGHRQISILSELAPYLTDAKQASILLGLFSPLLKHPPKVVPETVKTNMINIISNLFPLIPDLQDPVTPSFHKAFMLLSQLMQSLRTRPARSALTSAYRKLVEVDSSLSPLSNLIDDLNAYSTRRVDEPDFDRRISAFTKLDGDLSRTFTLTQWIPILYNMLHFIQDAEELALRTNSATVLRIFIDIVSKTPDGEWEGILMKNVYPGLKNGLRSKHESVRGEILAVIARAVAVCQNVPAFQEMRILLADGDEEVNFFNNIHHIQIHRRIRALRRFGEWCGEGRLRSSTLAEVFLPLIGHYIGATDSIDHHLVTEAINTTGSIAHCLAWGAYNNLIHQYLRLVRQKDASERVYVRTIVAILDNFHFNMDESVVVGGDVDEGADAEEPDTKKAQEMTRIADSVHSRLLPALLNHLERRDENEDTIRIPIAVGIVNVAKHLPDPARTTQVTRLLTILSQAFRSKSQETRDLTRDTLCRIAVTLGPDFLPDIIRELRGALLRGPHLHVLAVVAHALLVHLTSPENSGQFANFDDCVEDIAYVSAEVIFGESGKDVRSEGFKSKLREVRSSSSKGLDSFSILAKHVTSGKISALLHPARGIMQETETLKTLQLVDDVLKKIAGGINSNERMSPSDLLSLCQTLITQNAKFLQAAPVIKKRKPKKDEGSVIVQLKRTSRIDSNHYANNSFRFASPSTK
jgi:U3 small nucleolar RNA-associated protein 20